MSERARGVIVDFDQKLRHVGQSKRIYYHPTIEFETSEGQTCIFTYGSGSTRKRADVGDPIDVLYDPALLEFRRT